MSATLAQIHEDLSGLFRGELRTDSVSRSLYSTDGSLYEIEPLGIAAPLDRDDVVTLVRYASEHQIPLIPRGAGTSVSGESLGAGLIIDFARFMHQAEIGNAETVRVQPGVVLERLNAALHPLGRYFPPDPSGAAVTTLGSMLALDAAGAHSISIGSTRDYVESIEVVTADGAWFEAGIVPRQTAADLRSSENMGKDPSAPSIGTVGNGPAERLAMGIVQRLEPHSALIARHRSSALQRDRAGYRLDGVVQPDRVDLPRLLVGSEGTLACFTAATLRTLPLPRHRGALLVAFQSLDAAVRAVRALAELPLGACDLLDRRLLSLARETDSLFEQTIPAAIEAALIIEQTAETSTQITVQLADLQRLLTSLPQPGTILVSATTEAQVQWVWSLPNRVVPMLNRLTGSTRPIPFVEDIAVPPEHLEEFLNRVQKVLQRHDVIASTYAHAAAGQVHLRPFLPPVTPENSRKLNELAEECYEAAWSLGGTMCGEHGLGLSRSGFLQKQAGAVYPLHVQIKHFFDPQGLWNPAKILTSERGLPVRALRAQPVAPVMTELQLNWSTPQLVAEAAGCNGCGQCRSQQSAVRMCPFFRQSPSEQSAPRAKANAIRMLAGQNRWTELFSPALKSVTESCFNCKQCHRECPSGVNIPALAMEARAQLVATEGLSRHQFLLSRWHALAPWAALFPTAVNTLLRQPLFRRVMESITGLARLRRVPPFARHSFFDLAPREWLKPPRLLRQHQTVLLFLDTDSTWHHPENVIATGKLLEWAGYEVHVPRRQVAAGMPLIIAGDIEAARALALQNVRQLGDLARENCAIVCIEPTSAVCLKVEYPLLLDHPDVPVIASMVRDLSSLIGTKLDEQHASLVPLQSGRYAYHLPCHLRYLENHSRVADWCRDLVGADWTTIEAGCSGMPGIYGWDRKTYAHSMELGSRLGAALQPLRESVNVSECANCRLQMEQFTGRRSIHPVRLLAAAAGVTPDDRLGAGDRRRRGLAS